MASRANFYTPVRRDDRAEIIGELPAAMLGRVPDYDAQSLDPRWRSYLSTGDRKAFDRLFHHHLPQVKATALQMKGSRQFFERERLDDMVSDATLGLMKAFEATTLGGRRFYMFAPLIMRREVYRGAFYRIGKTFTMRRRKNMQVLKQARSALTMELGRVPTPEETTEVVRLLFDNPNIQIGDVPETVSLNAGNRGGLGRSIRR